MSVHSIDHRAVVTSGVDHTATVVSEFVRDGLIAADHAAIVVVGEQVLPGLVSRFAAELDRVVFAPSETWWAGSASATLARYEDAFLDALSAGHTRLHVVGKPVWYARGQAPDWCSYERRANTHFGGWPLRVLCVTDRRVGAKAAADFVAAHPRTLSGQANPLFR